ncbi:hypothetical protein REPUB_Repub12eG0021800 [Reevesia pubescens]
MWPPLLFISLKKFVFFFANFRNLNYISSIFFFFFSSIFFNPFFFFHFFRNPNYRSTKLCISIFLLCNFTSSSSIPISTLQCISLLHPSHFSFPVRGDSLSLTLIGEIDKNPKKWKINLKFKPFLCSPRQQTPLPLCSFLNLFLCVSKN